jgi:transposase
MVHIKLFKPIPVSGACEECNIQEDFTPAGKPTFNPVELLYGYLGKYVAEEAPKYNNGSGWTKENLKKILIEGKDSVTFDPWFEVGIVEHLQKCFQTCVSSF